MAIQDHPARDGEYRSQPAHGGRSAVIDAVVAWLRRELATAERDQQDAHFLATARGERYRPWS